MSRDAAIARARAYYDEGGFATDLARRVATVSSSQDEGALPSLRAYLADEIGPSLGKLGYDWQIVKNPVDGKPPFLVAERIEDKSLTTALTYGHGDTVRGMEGQWHDGRDPWTVTADGDRLYGRGTADNKGQHTINFAALAAVIAERGSLGFNSRILIETGEEVGSPGVEELCKAHRGDMLKSDLLIASDGPRLAADKPTISLGARGVMPIDLTVNLRHAAHHSGHWGGILPDPGIILANAIAALVDRKGRLQVPELRPRIPDAVKEAVKDLEIGAEGDARADPDWGESTLSLGERVFAFNALDVLAFETGNPARPVNAIPPKARAWCSLRYVVGTDPDDIVPAIRRHLDALGFGMVEVAAGTGGSFPATRLEPDDPWAQWAARSIERTTGIAPAVLPSIGGSLPNHCFSDVLGLRTIWVPHSYAGCQQHAPDEHLLAPVVRQGLEIMAGLFWDLGTGTAPGG